MIYLDSAATEKYGNFDDIIVDTITTAMRDSWQNPSSLYAANIKDKINKCRENIARFIGAESNEIYFTSGASESNNWAIRGWIDETWLNVYKTPHIITTKIEHKSILSLLEHGDLDVIINYCKIDKFGFVDIESLKQLLMMQNDNPILVSIHMANNEIGTIQPIKQISSLVHSYGGIVHVDATQAFCHIPINVKELGIDMMSVSGHKISPVLRGIGFLYKKNTVNIQPLIYGAQENGLRGGTENTYGILGLNKSIEVCDFSQDKINEMYSKRDYFICMLENNFDCKLNGDRWQRLPNNINVAFPQNITGESLLYMLGMRNIKISTGSACNSSEISTSHVLKAIGVSDNDAIKSVRFTLPEDITYEEINYVVKEIENTIKVIEMN